MTFEEWICSYNADLEKDNEALAKNAWDCQQKLIGKLVTDLVRLRHLIYSGQMNKMETMKYIDNMIEPLEGE